jgi:hypothetical protein
MARTIIRRRQPERRHRWLHISENVRSGHSFHPVRDTVFTRMLTWVGYTHCREEEPSDPSKPSGHVTSISVLRPYRRLGLANKLMRLSRTFALIPLLGAQRLTHLDPCRPRQKPPWQLTTRHRTSHYTCVNPTGPRYRCTGTLWDSRSQAWRKHIVSPFTEYGGSWWALINRVRGLRHGRRGRVWYEAGVREAIVKVLRGVKGTL